MTRPLALSLILAAGLLSWSTPARSAVIQVPGDQATIGAAIGAASPGDTIEVRRGTYRETLYMTDRTDLRIRARGRVVLDVVGLAYGAFIQESRDIRLEGFTIRNSLGEGIVIDRSDDITISRCAAIGTGSTGISVANSRGVDLDRNVVRRTGASGIVVNGTAIRIAGSRIEQTTGNGINAHGSRLLLEQNRIDQPRLAGIRLVENGMLLAALVRKNRIHRAGNTGIRIEGFGAILLDNRVVESGTDGMVAELGGGHLLSGNRITDSSGSGIVIRSNRCLLEENRVVRPGLVGIVLDGGVSRHNNVLQANRVDRAADFGFVVHASASLLHRNRSTRSGQPGLYDSGIGVPTAAIDNQFE